jgi:hypothetical protein
VIVVSAILSRGGRALHMPLPLTLILTLTLVLTLPQAQPTLPCVPANVGKALRFDGGLTGVR